MPNDRTLSAASCRVLAALFILAVLACISGAPAWARSLSNEPLPTGLGYLSGVSCAGLHCVAVGATPGSQPTSSVVLSSDGGRSWGAGIVVMPPGIMSLYGVSCTTASRCWAVGELAGGNHAAAVIASLDGGHTWSTQNVPAGLQNPTTIACAGLSCLATGPRMASVLVTRDGGTHWSNRKYQPKCTSRLCPASDIGAVALPSSRVGYLAGGSQCGGRHVTQCPAYIYKTSDGGTRWRQVFNGYPFIDAISCIDNSHCWAAGATFTTGVMLGSANGGRTWRRQTLPHFRGFFNGISCAIIGRTNHHHHHCVAVGQNEAGTGAVVAETNDGGSHWKLDRVPSGTGALFGVWCGRSGSVQIVGQDKRGSSALALGP